MNQEPFFLPVKITNRRYADGLFDSGEIFMRALHEFGSWGVFDQDEALQNKYRADLYSGVTEVFASPDDSEFFSRFPDDIKPKMCNCCYIDEGASQYFKIYSMICLDYDMNGNPVPVDPRMESFGDTAVIITDFSSFLGRIGNKLIDLYNPISILCKRMELFDFSVTRAINPVFYKYAGQAYQNEIRIAACSLQGPNALKALKKDYNPIKFSIGGIHDIAVKITTEQLITGNYTIPASKIVCPSSKDPHNPSIYDKVAAMTDLQMSLYHPDKYRPMFSTM